MRLIILCLATLSVTACDAVLGDKDRQYHWYNDREYKIDVFDLEGQPLLTIEVDYSGKAPKGGKHIKHDWRKKDTDFYDVQIENVSDYSISIDHIEYSMEKGKLYSGRFKSHDQVIADYGNGELQPTDVLKDHDAYIWAKQDNILHREFVFILDGQPLRVDIPLVYEP